MSRKAFLQVSGVTIALTVVGIAAVTYRGSLRKSREEAAMRIVHSAAGTGGVLMATDSSGLKYLNEVYAMPKTCTKENYADPTKSAFEKLFLCQPIPRPPTPEMVKKGTVQLPEDTRAIFMRRSFVFPDGRLTDPYATNGFGMARDGVVAVEKIKITEGPNKNMEGWVETSLLRRLCCPAL